MRIALNKTRLNKMRVRTFRTTLVSIHSSKCSLSNKAKLLRKGPTIKSKKSSISRENISIRRSDAVGKLLQGKTKRTKISSNKTRLLKIHLPINPQIRNTKKNQREIDHKQKNRLTAQMIKSLKMGQALKTKSPFFQRLTISNKSIWP